LPLQAFEFAQKTIVLGIRDDGLIQNVIAIIVFLERGPQGLDAPPEFVSFQPFLLRISMAWITARTWGLVQSTAPIR